MSSRPFVHAAAEALEETHLCTLVHPRGQSAAVEGSAHLSKPEYPRVCRPGRPFPPKIYLDP